MIGGILIALSSIQVTEGPLLDVFVINRREDYRDIIRGFTDTIITT